MEDPDLSSCPIRSDHQTTGLTLTTGVPHRCTNGRGANNINIHYDVTGLLMQCGGHTQVRLSGLSELAREKGEFCTHSTYV